MLTDKQNELLNDYITGTYGTGQYKDYVYYSEAHKIKPVSDRHFYRYRHFYREIKSGNFEYDRTEYLKVAKKYRLGNNSIHFLFMQCNLKKTNIKNPVNIDTIVKNYESALRERNNMIVDLKYESEMYHDLWTKGQNKYEKLYKKKQILQSMYNEQLKYVQYSRDNITQLANTITQLGKRLYNIGTELKLVLECRYFNRTEKLKNILTNYFENKI